MRKFMWILFVAALTVFGFAMAQVSVPLVPTTGGGGTYILGANSAAVNQLVNVNIPQAYGLAIDDAASIAFDLSTDWSKTQMVCVTGLAVDGTIADQPGPSGGVYPLGTHYTIQFPNITVLGGNEVTNYPPIAYTGEPGTAINVGSKGDFVCYRSFYLEKFANTKGWDVTVQRTDGQNSGGLASTPMYVQDNVCAAPSAATGMFPLANNDTVDLFANAPDSVLAIQNMTTGAAAEAGGTVCGQPTSWLNDLVVLAIKVDGNQAGNFNTTLTYTIQAIQPPPS